MHREDSRTVRPRVERDGMAWPPAAWETTPSAAADGRECGADKLSGASGSARDEALIRDIVQTLVLTVVMFFTLRAVLQNFIVESYSMEPTLHEDHQIWVDRVSYRFGDGPSRGDIVVFQSWDQDKPFVKRVVGLPGETISIHDGDVYADEQRLDEPYLHQRTEGGQEPVTLGENEFFVLGDNRGNSGDSRYYGALTGDDIIGRAWVRYWPPGEIGILSGPGRSFAFDGADPP